MNQPPLLPTSDVSPRLVAIQQHFHNWIVRPAWWSQAIAKLEANDVSLITLPSDLNTAAAWLATELRRVVTYVPDTELGFGNAEVLPVNPVLRGDCEDLNVFLYLGTLWHAIPEARPRLGAFYTPNVRQPTHVIAALQTGPHDLDLVDLISHSSTPPTNGGLVPLLRA